jgi:hypothetical protein
MPARPLCCAACICALPVSILFSHRQAKNFKIVESRCYQSVFVGEERDAVICGATLSIALQQFAADLRGDILKSLPARTADTTYS